MPHTLVALGDLPRFKDVPFNQVPGRYIDYWSHYKKYSWGASNNRIYSLNRIMYEQYWLIDGRLDQYYIFIYTIHNERGEYIGYDELVVREFDTNNLYKARKG